MNRLTTLIESCIPGLHDRAPLRRELHEAVPDAKASIPGLHDRAPLRLMSCRPFTGRFWVFPVFMTGLH